MQIRTVRLADDTHKLPWPGVAGAFAPAGPFEVDTDDPFWFGCLQDGSLQYHVPPAKTGKDAAPEPQGSPARV